MSSVTRNNQLFWRIARWLYENEEMYDEDPFEDFADCLYDKAAVLYAKIINHDFAGGDDHND